MAIIPAVVVVDLDGTLANCLHRIPLVRNGNHDWDKFFKEVVNDTPYEDMTRLVTLLYGSGLDIVIVSARRKDTESDTLNWLHKHLPNVAFALVLVRENGDHSPDQELKKKWLDTIDKEQILFVLEDRQRVVDMWRANGVRCLQAQAWEEDKK